MMKQLHCLLLTLFGFTAALQADSPNILLILTDDQGWSQRSGLMDTENPETASSYLHTPAMDRIAEEGMGSLPPFYADKKVRINPHEQPQ